MAKVRFIKDRFIDKLSKSITQIFRLRFKPGERIAVKLHMGEFGNINYLRPVWARVVVDALKEAGAHPFLFDSTTLYQGKRHTVEDYLETAKKHGYSEDTVGCPIVISDEGSEINTSHLKAEVCKELIKADGMVVLTHVKGHECSGIGGAIKNLGMGGVCAATKGAIHTGAQPFWDDKKCTRCRTCVEVCHNKLISLEHMKVDINYEGCYACNVCIFHCPTKALKPKIAMFDELLSEGASAVLDNFRKDKLYFINMLLDLADKCDCSRGKNRIVVDNIGILMSDDIVAVDKASLDLINKKAEKKIFDIIHNRPSEQHIIEAEKLGMGSRDYDLEDVS